MAVNVMGIVILFTMCLFRDTICQNMHPDFVKSEQKIHKFPENDQYPAKWMEGGKERLHSMLHKKRNFKVAKNLILFVGDGMGITTITAGRIHKGQIKGNYGEEEITYMEQLDDLALSKTYNIDAQTADSAGTATAFLTGVKTRIGSVGVDGRAFDCPTSNNFKLESILKWAKKAGKSTGIVTTTKLTHATPSSAYASIYDREMEAFDGINFKQEHLSLGCKDIADQFLENSASINVVFAGGRSKFLPNNESDPSFSNKLGDRIDGRNLIDEWHRKMQGNNLTHKYVWNIQQFNQLDPENDKYDHVLGLMSFSHMDYESDRARKSPIEEPSLVEMTEKAIRILRRNPNGYFLLVEGGKIDHAHHDSLAKKALEEFATFDDSVGRAMNLTSTKNTLITVTADHSHVFTLGGYAFRGNPILGIVSGVYVNVSDLSVTLTSLLYGNGPGFYNLSGVRTVNLTNEQTSRDDYRQESAIPLGSETHGGEDVSVYASGPMSFLFDGTIEQNYIAHVMAYSSCIGPYNTFTCRRERGEKHVEIFRYFNSARALLDSYAMLCITVTSFFSSLVIYR